MAGISEILRKLRHQQGGTSQLLDQLHNFRVSFRNQGEVQGLTGAQLGLHQLPDIGQQFPLLLRSPRLPALAARTSEVPAVKQFPLPVFLVPKQKLEAEVADGHLLPFLDLSDRSQFLVFAINDSSSRPTESVMLGL